MITEPLAAGRKPHNRTWAVIICYRPQQELVAALAHALLIQAEQVLILDNDAASSTLDLLHIDRVIHVPMPSNLGTAAAMNRAWQMALQANAEFVICFDQDSVVSDNLIASLLSRWQQLKKNGYCPGAVGPAWEDARTHRMLRALKPAGWRRQRVDSDTAASIEVDHLITSGCLIHRDSWLTTGPFDESLFLDYVDIEWNLRARNRGFHFYVTRDAKMQHAIGDSVISIFGRSLWIHQPMRQYLLVRNHLLLWRRPYISLSWKCRDALQVAMKTGLVLAFRGPRWQRLAWITRGIWDGLKGRSGPIM
jgi:rhamnosyltransferase